MECTSKAVNGAVSVVVGDEPQPASAAVVDIPSSSGDAAALPPTVSAVAASKPIPTKQCNPLMIGGGTLVINRKRQQNNPMIQ